MEYRSTFPCHSKITSYFAEKWFEGGINEEHVNLLKREYLFALHTFLARRLLSFLPVIKEIRELASCVKVIVKKEYANLLALNLLRIISY
jgi:hypothetical protein